jgi:hypothetical protein
VSLSQPDPSPPGELATRWPGWSSGDRRRAAASRKLSLYGERHKAMVQGLIADRLQDPQVVAQVSKFADRSPNLARSVVSAVAVAYSRGCRRELTELGEGASTAFASLVDECGADRLAPMINAAAWLTGPTLVIPHLDRRRRLALDVITPDANDVRAAGDEIDAAVWRRPDGVWVELDAEAWRYIDDAGDLIRTAPHGAGVCPATVFRADGNLGDWWATDIHAGLCDATLTVAYKMALGLWTRQVSSNKFTVIYGDIEGVAPGQTIAHHALPLFLGPKGSAGVEVHDRNVPAMDWLAEVRTIITLAVAAYGLPPSSVTFENSSGDWGTLAIAVRGEALGLLRNKQVPWLRHSELELWPTACDVARAGGHRLAGQLPPGDEVRDALRAYFPDISQPAERKARMEALAAEVPYGLASPEDYLLASRPELTREEAAEEIQRNRERELQRLEALASRNVAATPDRGLQSIAQLQGREGGLQSGAVRREENETP